MVDRQKVAAGVDVDVVLGDGGDCDTERAHDPQGTECGHDRQHPARAPGWYDAVRKNQESEPE